MARRERFFVNVVSNVLIVAMIAVVAAFSFSGRIVGAFRDASPRPIYSGNAANGGVSLMINVCWGEEYLDGMLRVLEEAGAKATFFIGGSWAEKNPDKLKAIVEAGHEIGNHGYFHKSHDKLSAEANREEIVATQNMIESICGVKTVLFAPPSGAFGKTALEVAAGLGYKTVMWSKDTIDWRDKDTAKITKRATRNLVAGDLILMHPTEKTLDALPDILSAIAASNLSAVTVSENISSDT